MAGFAASRQSSRSLVHLLLRDFLLNPDDDEFGRLQWCKTDDHDDLSTIDVILRHGVAQSAADEIDVRGFVAVERAGAKEPIHK